MSGGGRFCRVIRHIADHFWINTADYVTAERNLPRDYQNSALPWQKS
jgi:hypothetical protein